MPKLKKVDKDSRVKWKEYLGDVHKILTFEKQESEENNPKSKITALLITPILLDLRILQITHHITLSAGNP
jgi:hypothetical protein